MKSGQSCLTSHHRFIQVTSFLICFLILSSTHLRSKVEGRPESKPVDFAKRVNGEEVMMRAQIGSRPPRCEGRCRSCGHCEAIQVPTNPQVQNRIKGSSPTLNADYYERGNSGDSGSNYKPMSWKCKCGNLIFNP